MRMRTWKRSWLWVSVLLFCFAAFLGAGAQKALAGPVASCAGKIPPLGQKMAWPVDGGVVRSWSLDCATGQGHRGIDIEAAAGSSIRAAEDGVISFVGFTPAEGGGQTIAINHLSGLKSTYLHLAQTNVTAGQSVARGQVIGTSAGPALHFGVKMSSGAGYLNPLELLEEKEPVPPPEQAAPPAAAPAPVSQPETPPAAAKPAPPVPASVPQPAAKPGAAAASAASRSPVRQPDRGTFSAGHPVAASVRTSERKELKPGQPLSMTTVSDPGFSRSRVLNYQFHDRPESPAGAAEKIKVESGAGRSHGRSGLPGAGAVLASVGIIIAAAAAAAAATRRAAATPRLREKHDALAISAFP